MKITLILLVYYSFFSEKKNNNFPELQGKTTSRLLSLRVFFCVTLFRKNKKYHPNMVRWCFSSFTTSWKSLLSQQGWNYIKHCQYCKKVDIAVFFPSLRVDVVLKNKVGPSQVNAANSYLCFGWQEQVTESLGRREEMLSWVFDLFFTEFLTCNVGIPLIYCLSF